MHWYVDFRDPARPADPNPPSLFEWAGGLPALTRMTRLLYEKHVPADDLLAPLFASMAPDRPRREAAVIAAAFGGPAAPQATGPAGHVRGAARPLGGPGCPGRRARPACRPTRRSVRPSSPTWSGTRGPVVRRRQLGLGARGPPAPVAGRDRTGTRP